MMTSKLKNDSVPTSLNRSLRNRPSRLLYQPPAQRCADKQLKSSSSPEAQTIKSETFSKTISLSKLNEHKRKPLCGFKQAKEQSPLAYSRITPSSPRCQENLRGASNAKLKSTENPYLSERKPGLGRGNLLKLQLRYEHEFVKANRIHNPIENQTNSDKEDAVHVPNLVKTDSQLSTDFNHNNSNNNHLGKPFLELPGSDSPASKFHNVATPQKINNSKPLMCEDIVSSQNPKWQENIVPPSTKLHDGMQYVSEEAVWEKGKGDDLQNIAESFGPGDWDPKEEACSTPDLDISLLSLQKTPKAKNDDNSVLDHNFGLTLGDLKEATEIFYSSNETEEEVFDSQGSVLSDETYLTVSSHLSDVEENTESMSRSTDGCDYNSLLSESNSLVECISGDSSTDVFSTPAKTSFNDSQDVNKRSSESSLSFQNNSKVDVTNFTDSTDRINCHANYKSGDNQLQWNTVQVKNQISLKEHSILPPKPKSSPKSDRCQMSDLTATSSTKYPSPCSSNSGQKNFSFCSSPTYYQNPTSLSPQTPMVSHSVFENSSSCRASHLQSCNKENISKELAKHVSYQQVGHRPRHFCSGTKSEGFIIDALRSRVKEFYYRNQNHWKRSAFQYKQIFGGIESWKENYKKKCSEAGHKFLDTHCHIDMMLTEHLDRIYGTFQEYRQANADTFPQEFGGCVAIFCNPLTFNPRGSLFRSLINEQNVWIAVGCHPKKVKFLNERTLMQLNACIRMPEVVAVGEIGLDYSGMFCLEADVQKEVFRNQIKLALDVSKPIVIHCRDAEDDCFSILKEECPLDWLIHLHCYTLDFEHAQKWLDTFPNLYIGLTPKVTYKNAFAVHDTARKIPLTRLVLESDAPYFIPSMVPYNALKCSHPGLVFTVAERVAKLQGRDIKEVLKACWDNSLRLYRINPDI